MADLQDDDIVGKAYDARLARRLVVFIRPYWRSIMLALAAITVGAMASLAQPYLVKIAVDRHIASGDADGLGRLALLYLGVLVCAFVAEFVQTWTLQLTGQRLMFDMRMAIYRHLQRLDVRFYDRHPVGRLMTRVTSDVDALNELFTSGVVTIFGDVFTLVGIAAVLVWMDWRLALVTLSVLPLILAVTQWFRRHVRHSYRDVRGWIARINAFLQENITGMMTVQAFNRERLDFERFDEIDRQHRDANVDSIFYYAVFYPAIEAISALASALIIWYGGGNVLRGSITLGALAAFLQYSLRFFRPISDMSEKFNVLQSAMASSERIFKLLDEPVHVASPPDAQRAGPGREAARVEFDHVWFAYDDAAGKEPDWVLRDVSFVLEPGQRLGIVGATGSGKTTIINLLLRFYDVQRGRILVDGIDVRHWDLDALRANFALVLQDVQLFSGTVADNIRLGRSDITDAQVVEAAQAALADGFIRRLPGGYEALVAERGSTLSAGQRQLLSFARALAFAPRVLVLDEATSNVDTDTESLIRAALQTLMAGRSTIAIAHRLSTIQDMEQILVLHKGEVREIGTHQQLLALRGIYYRLFELQYAGVSAGTASAAS